MIAPPISVLFPGARFLVVWTLWAIALLFVALAPSGPTNGGILLATAAAVLWAADCLRRMRQWDASALVPGYASTAWAVAVGIVWSVVALASTISSLAGNAEPAFGVATLAGTVLVVCLTYLDLHQRNPWQFGMTGVMILGLTVLLADHQGVIRWRYAALPVSQSAALVLAIVAAVVLKRQLGTPTRPHTESALPGRYFHPRVGGLKVLLGLGQPPTGIGEAIVLGITGSLAVGAYFPVVYPAGVIVPVVGLVTFVASLTPLMLLKAAAAWLPTAWQLGIGESRRHLGRSFASRVVAMTLAAFGLAIAIVGVQALLGGHVPSRLPGLGNQFDETLLLCATCLVVFTVACSARPTRTAKQPSHVGSLGLVCTAFLIVSFTAPSFGLLGRTVLLAAIVGSAALAVYAGGGLVARFDFLPTSED